MISRQISSFVILPKLSYRELLVNSSVICFGAIFGLLLFVGAPGLVRTLYPAAAMGVAAFLFSVNRGKYVEFVIWMYMLTPFVRRVADYQSEYQEVSLIMLAPLLASSISTIIVFKKLPLLYNISFFPFLLAIIGVLYGLFIGVVNSGPSAAFYDFLLWAVPIAFGFSIASDWRSFPMYRDAIFRVFLWGGIILGAYGIYQYFFLPRWDAHWILNAKIASVGLPLPLLVRVYSTMNSPVPFGAIMIPTLLIAFFANSLIRFPSALLGFIAFALSVVRTAWLGWLVAVIYLIVMLRGTRKLTLISGMAVVALFAIPIVTTGDIGERFVEKLESFANLEDDESFQARSSLYGSKTEQALTSFWGIGTGAVGVATKLTSQSQTVVNIDSGFLIIPYVLGWPGAFLMLISIGWLMLKPPGVVDERSEIVIKVSTAICVAYIAMMISYNSMHGVGGILFWTFIGLRMSARLWSQRMPFNQTCSTS